MAMNWQEVFGVDLDVSHMVMNWQEVFGDDWAYTKH